MNVLQTLVAELFDVSSQRLLTTPGKSTASQIPNYTGLRIAGAKAHAQC